LSILKTLEKIAFFPASYELNFLPAPVQADEKIQLDNCRNGSAISDTIVCTLKQKSERIATRRT